MHKPKYEIAIKRLSTLVDNLYEQAKAVDNINSKHKSHRLIEDNDIFSQHLFSTQSDKVSLYVDEVKNKIHEFSRLHGLSTNNANRAEFAKSSLLHIEQQISALLNAIKANQAMHQAAQVSFNAKIHYRNKSKKNVQMKATNKYQKVTQTVLQSSHSLYQQLSEHHEFERRLLDMITEREQQRVRSTNSNNAISQEVLALHQRLGRCRKAISAIERNIEAAEKSSLA